MQTVIVVPGYLESNLNADPLQALRIWVSYPLLALGAFGWLRLAPGSTSPGPPDGVELYPAGALPEYFHLPTTELRRQLRPHGVAVEEFGWDWRKTQVTAGNLLAERIRQVATPLQPATLVAHSAGGIVCRAAWSALGTTNEHGLVRRIVTLGTPHYGSYYSAGAWLTDNAMIASIVYVNENVGRVPTPTGTLPGFRAWSARQLADLVQTWPSTYELLPLLDAPDAADDPYRPALYAPGNWGHGAAPQASWLAWSQFSHGPWLRSAVSIPPAHVLTCVSGDGTSTPATLARPDQLGKGIAWGNSAAGDGVVTTRSAELAGSVVHRTLYRHEDIYYHSTFSGELVQWILAERSPTDPVPSPTENLALRPAVLFSPPLPQGFERRGQSADCQGRHCHC